MAAHIIRVIALMALAACAPSANEGLRLDPVAPPVAGPHLVTWLALSQDGPAEGQHSASFSAEGAGRVSLAFLPQGRGAWWVSATCDAGVRVRAVEGEVSPPMWSRAGQPVTLHLQSGERGQSWLDLDPATQDCTLTVTPGGRPSWSLHLQREDLARPQVARLDAAGRTCAAAGGDALERAFMATGDLAASCPLPMGPVRLLEQGLDALNARVEALTGRALPREALLAGNAEMPLDFSAAPQLDLIYVTYLNLNADFAGYLTARMLAWHASRGTLVRILVSEVMLTATDRDLFEGLAARYPNVQIQPFHLPASAAQGLDGQLGRLHRVTHVKLFATVARQPRRSVAILGGRNIHEGYFFDSPRDLSAQPWLHQYDVSQTRLTGGFTTYQDFEIALNDDRAVRSIVGHMAALWHRDHDSQTLRPVQGAAALPGVEEGMMRHFLSVPFSDGQAQEAYYAGLIDAAQQSIRVAIPYLNLPPPLEAALLRARARGVRVDVVTTVRVREATDFMVTGLNRDFANRFGDWVRFFDFDPYPQLLHAKLIVIDGRLAIVGSTNLNQRSFVHDMENGVVVLDRRLAAQLDGVIQGWIDRGQQVRPGQPISRLGALLARVGFIRRGF